MRRPVAVENWYQGAIPTSLPAELITVTQRRPPGGARWRHHASIHAGAENGWPQSTARRSQSARYGSSSLGSLMTTAVIVECPFEVVAGEAGWGNRGSKASAFAEASGVSRKAVSGAAHPWPERAWSAATGPCHS